VGRPALDRFAVLSERERRDRNASFAVRMQVELVLVPKDMLLAPMLPLDKSHLLVMIYLEQRQIKRATNQLGIPQQIVSHSFLVPELASVSVSRRESSAIKSQHMEMAQAYYMKLLVGHELDGSIRKYPQQRC
jgi:hypothetical protein